jgi:RHS repeat-associated protein
LTESIYSGGRLIAQESTGSISNFYSDRLSNRMITDSAGNYLATQSHEPFGEALSESGVQSKWKFTNYERDDETGSDYAINRQYGTSTGRFFRPDPIAGSIVNPQSLQHIEAGMRKMGKSPLKIRIASQW